MTDDELERALFALPLEEPPADLRRRILSATVYRPRMIFRTAEIWGLGTALAIMVWLSWYVMTGIPNVGGKFGFVFSSLLAVVGGNIPANAWLWLALGVSSTIWISQVSLMPARTRITDH
jgi:4-amino-4-deoxy-L-arabinose transferase-like glycosyltransferase